MPATMQQVLAELDRDEPDYEALRALGPDALPHLQMIIEANDPLRAAKATYAASLIGGDRSVDLLGKAAAHPDPQVRVAAAYGLRNLPPDAPSDLLGDLLDDGDAGVRKAALGTVGDLGRADLRDKVEAIASQDPHEFLRQAAAAAARTMD